MNLFKIINKIFFKSGAGIIWIIYNLSYIVLISFIYKNNPSTVIFSITTYLIIASAIGLMPLIVVSIRKTNFCKKQLIVNNNKINNWVPLFYFFPIIFISYFIGLLTIFLINIDEKEQIKIIFNSINWFEFLFSISLVIIFSLMIGQMLFLFFSNILIIQTIGTFILIVGSMLSGMFFPIKDLKNIIIIKQLVLINPFTYLNNLVINAWTSKGGNEFMNLNSGGIFDFTKNFEILSPLDKLTDIENETYKTIWKKDILFTSNIKIFNLLIPIILILLMLPISFFKNSLLEFNTKYGLKNFKRNKVISKIQSKKLIEIKNLSKRFFNKIVFNNLSLTINKKDLIGLIGKNGIGKTTFFKIIMHFGNADEGEINYFYKYKKSPIEKMGFLLQETKYPETFSVKNVINLFINKKNDSKILKKLNQILEINNILNKKVKILSGGEKQKLSLFITLIEKPKIIFLDEFTNNIDIVSKIKIIDYLKKIFKKFGITCFLITHDITVLKYFCNKIVLLNNNGFKLIPKNKLNKKDIVNFIK